MKKNSKLEVLSENNQNSWSSSLEEHPAVQWVADHAKKLLYGLIALILLLLIGYRLSSSFTTSSETDFINAEKSYLSFENSVKDENDAAVRNAALEKLKKIISAHPELHAKYDGLIAQNLLISGDASQASEYANLAINRTQDENSPFYTNYAKSTLLIANQRYEEALKEATFLKEQMDVKGQEIANQPEKAEFSTLLYALNLLRVGMLQQQLALKNQELKTWENWKDLVKKGKENKMPTYLDGQLFIAIDGLLSEGGASFSNYLETRENFLKK